MVQQGRANKLSNKMAFGSYLKNRMTRRCTRTIVPLRSKIAGELGRYMPNPARTNQGNPTIG